MVIAITYCYSDLAIDTGPFPLNQSCFFWMTFDTKYIQTSNLKLSYENREHLLKFLAWMNFFYSIWYSAYYEKQNKQNKIKQKRKHLFHTKQGVFCSEKCSSGYRINNILCEGLNILLHHSSSCMMCSLQKVL